MGQYTVVAVVFISLLSFLYLTTQEIVKFKLKKEQIKADALIKTEEIKAKNQLDIEKLMFQDKVETSQSVNYGGTNSSQADTSNERRDRLNERM